MSMEVRADRARENQGTEAPRAVALESSPESRGPTQNRGKQTADASITRPPMYFRSPVDGEWKPTGTKLHAEKFGALAGTAEAPTYEDSGVYVTGPHALSPEAKKPVATGFKGALQKLVVWLTFGITQNKDQYPPFDGNEPLAKALDGKIQPGDFILNGNGSDGHVDRALGFFEPVGEPLGRVRKWYSLGESMSAKEAQAAAKQVDPRALAFLDKDKQWQAWVPVSLADARKHYEAHRKAGTRGHETVQFMLQHSMATERTRRSPLQRLFIDTPSAIIRGFPGTGTFAEPMRDFFNRFPRSDYYVVRDPLMTPEMNERATRKGVLNHGKRYDFWFGLGGQGDEKSYCKEDIDNALMDGREGTDVPMPYVATLRYIQKVPLVGTVLDQWVSEPRGLASDHFEFVTGNESGKRVYERTRQELVFPVNPPVLKQSA